MHQSRHQGAAASAYLIGELVAAPVGRRFPNLEDVPPLLPWQHVRLITGADGTEPRHQSFPYMRANNEL